MRKTMHAAGENPVVSRITEQLINQGKTQKQLTEYIGGTQGMYSDWKSGRVKSYERYIDKIADFLNVSKSYLLTGYDEDPDEMELLRIYRNLTKEKKTRLLLVAQTI
jgi:transcriptional regulator with XRE-family HTH domain